MFQAVHVVARRLNLTPPWVWLNRLLTFLAATVAWVFFRAPSLPRRAAYGRQGRPGRRGAGALRLPPVLLAFIAAGLLWVNFMPNAWRTGPRPRLGQAIVVGVLLAACLLALGKPNPFLYLQF